MKIDNSGKPLNTAVSRADSKASAKATGGTSASSGASESDSVDISSHLQTLAGSLASQPAMDEAKVAEIRQAIADGRFSVKPDAIADKLMKSVKDLLSGK